MERADGEDTRAERGPRNDVSGEVTGPVIQAGNIGQVHVTWGEAASHRAPEQGENAEAVRPSAGARRWRRSRSARDATTGGRKGKVRLPLVLALVSAIGAGVALQPQIRGVVSGAGSEPAPSATSSATTSADTSAAASADQDLAVSVETVRLDDEGLWAATSGDFRPSPAQSRFLAKPMSAASDEFDDFLRSTGAVRVGEQTLRLTLTGRDDQQVNVLDIRPVDVHRARPLAGTLFAVGSQAGSATFKVIYDLDRPRPVARKAELNTELYEYRPGPPFFADTTITLRRGEQNVVVARARAQRFHVKFRLDVTYMVGDRRKHKVIDDHGRPFQVTGFSRGPDGEERYQRVFSLQNDYSMCQTVGPGADPERQCEGS